MDNLAHDISSKSSDFVNSLIDWWYVVGWSSSITTEPKATYLLDRRIVIWRDAEKTVRAAYDQCPHRGTQLSLGTVDGAGCLVCPYHGWTFDSEGRCVTIPQLTPEAPIPRRIKLVTLHCEERYGMVWVCLGTPKTPIPNFPSWERPGFRHVECAPYTWRCSPERMVENFMDFGHLGYLHDGLLGSRDDLVVPNHHVTRDEHELHFELTMTVPSTNDSFGVTEMKDKQGKQTNTYVLSAPYTIFLQSYYHDTGASRALFFSVQPNSHRESTGYCYQSRDFKLTDADEPFTEFQALLADQDKPIVESQHPFEAPLTLTEEVHLPFDKVAVVYRRLLKDLKADELVLGIPDSAGNTSDQERIETAK